ncbi:lipopolysaccharide-induced tumor necrosis factor-alpha factor homolog [Chrysoperla carnea]|uniref:lipopolysaccharide-induced tumor necrosis factor-alpha factor homolog n=1 Tax=Chrysoperla carnea TaxID=189513 RepID=UPI001D077E02|nr:lipopolysaccharide-induced tumor necrosis factor-alpha factor homolog [Chrysoperla carnea]
MDNKQHGNPPPYSQAPPPGPGFHVPPTAPPPVVLVPSNVGPDPATITCPSCRANIRTRIEYESTTKTHLFALLLFLIGCWPCCCIPYCMDSCNNANHYCPNCGSFIGSYKS